MIAPCSPAPEIAGKLSPRKPSSSPRSASSLSAADSSVAAPVGPTASSQCRKRQTATASRAWAARAPARSVAFLQALGSRQGSGPAGGIDPHALAAQPDQRAGQRVAPRHDDAVAEPFAGLGRQLGRIHEQFAAPVGVGQREAEREGGERHVLAADVQQPGDRGRVADHRRILLRLAQDGGDLLALLRRRLAGVA
jgi:hypothetical protein